MPTDNEVRDALQTWSGKRPKMSQNLKDWWDQNQPALGPFDPNGIDKLLNVLRNTFRSSPQLSAADFKAGGNITTAQDLADLLAPVGKPSPAAAVTAAGAAVKSPPPKKGAAAKSSKKGRHT